MCVDLLCYLDLCMLIDVLVQSPSSNDVKNLSETSAILADDQYLTPVVEDDPLLRA